MEGTISTLVFLLPPTGEDQYGPGDFIDIQVASWKVDCKLRFWGTPTCLSLRLFPQLFWHKLRGG